MFAIRSNGREACATCSAVVNRATQISSLSLTGVIQTHVPIQKLKFLLKFFLLKNTLF